MPGLKRCGRCASVLDLSDVPWQPPRSRQSKGARAVATALRRDLLATRDDLGRGRERLRGALAGVGATPASWTAVMLSILPGLGHLWLGRRWLGTIIALAWLLLLAAMLFEFGTSTGWLFYFFAVGLHTLTLSLLFAPALRYVGMLHRALIGVAVWAAVQAALYVPAGWLASRCVTLTRIENVLPNAAVENGDLLVSTGAWIDGGPWERGDLVLYHVAARSGQGFALEAGQAIDRIVAVAGDVVDMRAGTLRVNGAVVSAEGWPINGLGSIPENFHEVVGPDRVLIVPSTVSAVNRPFDSAWQAAYVRLVAQSAVVPTDHVIGRVAFRLLPWSRSGSITAPPPNESNQPRPDTDAPAP